MSFTTQKFNCKVSHTEWPINYDHLLDFGGSMLKYGND